MGFLDHFKEININESRSGEEMFVALYGYNLQDFIHGNANPVTFWSSEKINEGMDKTSMTLENPLVVESSDYEMGDIYFETKCVGYAVEYGYHSVIIETDERSYYMVIDFDEEAVVDEYITEAKVPKAQRKIDKAEKLAQKKADKQPVTSKPKRAPQKGIRVDVLLSNTGKLSPDRVQRAMKQVRKQPPKISGVKEVQGIKVFRAEYNFKSTGSKNRQMGYADISQDKKFCSEMFCSCSDFFYRLYAPYVAAGLATWNIPPKYKSKQNTTVPTTPHNHKWTEKTNPLGKLFLCKHLWAFMAYYVAGDAGNVELGDDEIDGIINQYFGDLDGDGEEEMTDTEFKKAFGKLYVGQQGADIEHIEDKEKAKEQKGKRQTYYQLPSEKKKQGEKLSKSRSKKEKPEEPEEDEK